MAQYQNGQYYYQQQQNQDQYQQGLPGRRPPSFAAGDDNPYGINGNEYQEYGASQGSVPGRSNSTAARQNAEMFLDQGRPPLPSGPAIQTSASAFAPHSPPANQPAYNPQDYATPVSATFPQHTSSASHRAGYPSPTPPAAYNPADYADGSIHRMGSTAGYQQDYSSGYQYPAQAGASMPSPSLYQNTIVNRPQSVYPSRPTVQTTSRPSHYTPPAPPPLPAIPGSAGTPGDDWGQIPTRYTSTYRRYGDTSILLSPGQSSVSSPPLRQESRGSRSSDQSPNPSSLPPTPGPPPPPHGSTTLPSYQHPQSRPLPLLPSDPSPLQPGYFDISSNDGLSATAAAEQEDLEQQILDLTTHNESAEAEHKVNGGSYHDSDAEAEAGLAAMREAERQDAEDEARRQSGSMFGYRASIIATAPPPIQTEASDSDVPIDLASFGGGFDAHMSYGGDPSALTVARTGSQSEALSRSQPVSSSGSLRRPGGDASESEGYEYGASIHPFPPFSQARVDAFGTGGLADPSVSTRSRRLSYDEGDEAPLTEYSTLGPGQPPERYYQHSPGSSFRDRPLPPPPNSPPRHYSSPGAPYPSEWSRSQQAQFPPTPAYGPGAYYPQSPQTGSGLPRHTSLVSHPSAPQLPAPARAKTDAEERRRLQQRLSTNITSDSSGNNTADGSVVALDLPSITKKFNPSKLNARDFDRCREPWALSGLVMWLRWVAEGEQFLKKSQLVDALVALFTHKVPTMNISDAETLGANLVDEMHESGTLYDEEEWLVFSDRPMSGVVFQLMGKGCYAPKLHDYDNSGRCYAHLCHRTEKKIDLSAQPAISQDEDWATYYKLKKDDLEGISKKELDRQNILHEIVQKEENYLRDLHVLIKLYRDQLAKANPGIIAPKKLHSFLWDVFGKAEAVKKANEEHLLPQMKYRQKEQGPWVVGFSDIFREWIRKAKTAYLEYASQFPQASYKVRQEKERNIMFRQFLERCQADPQSKRLGWDHYLKVPISRLQQVVFLLENALKKSIQDTDEKRNLQIAIEEIKTITHECDARVGDGLRKVDLTDLQNKLKLRPGMQGVQLNLDHLGREVIFQGEVLRIGGSRFTWLETHAILFDHYLVLAKTIQDKASDGSAKYERYDVSRQPIPMDLLLLESRDDDPVVRSTLAGRAGVTRVAPSAATQEQMRLARTVSNQSPTPTGLATATGNGALGALNRVSSTQSTTPTVTSLDAPKDDRTLYPFRIKHLGKETYTLYAPTLQNREDWCNKLIEAKTKHAAALFAQNAEPFKLRVMADSAFAYESAVAGQRGIVIKGTPLDRAIRDVEKAYANTGRPAPVCRARVNCATSFSQQGKQMVAVGTDFGVYVSESDNPRGWIRVITNPKVTQIAVLEEFMLFLLISDKALIAYHLDVVCPAGGVPPANDSARRAPQKLSGSRDVGFFATGRMKDRTLVFYKKRDGIHSTFKALEPVLAKATEKRSRFAPLRSGKTDFFRDFDEFYIPTECSGLNMFHSSLAVCTTRGFEVLTLDKKQPVSIPDLDASHVQIIAQRLAAQKPLGMFRLSDQEFLLVYDECAVYVNKHGDISRSVIMEFVGRARAAALFGPYVLLFDADFVEVRNAQNGRLRQVIAGRDVRCLDDALGGPPPETGVARRSVKLALQHPEVEKLQLVLELVLNEGLRE